MEQTDDTISLYFHTYFENMVSLKEIDHVPEEILYLNPEASMEASEFQLGLGIIVVENCMAISYNTFDILYPLCLSVVLGMKNIENPNKTEKSLLNMASRILLCLNGEVNSAFTVRKRLVEADGISNLTEELHFVSLLCIKFKKSSIAWAYRLFLLLRVLGNCEDKGLLGVFENEVAFIENHLTKHPRNYYAWSHRLLVLKEILLRFGKEKRRVLLMNEAARIKKFCEKNIHEYSAFHYLQYLTKRMDEEKLVDLNEEKAWILQLMMIYEECYDVVETGIEKKQEEKLFSLKKHLKFLEEF